MRHYNFIYDVEGITTRDIAVYIYLEDRADQNGICWPSIKRIAKDTKMSVSTAKRAIKALKTLGLITTKQRYLKDGGKTSLEYTLKPYNQGYSFLSSVKK